MNEMSEYKPALQLRPFVQSYWMGGFNVNAEAQFSQSVIPNGFVELVVHLTDDHCYLSKHEDSWASSPDYTLIGIYKKPYEVRFSNMVRVFGIRFYPEGITNIFGVPPAHIQSTFEDSVDVFGRKFKEYCQRLREMRFLEEMIGLTNRFLSNLLELNKKEVDYAGHAAEIIRERNGMLKQNALMDSIYISPRQLQREFKKQYGLTAKEYMRLIRLNTIQRYLQINEKVNFSDLTYEHGFSDQSHFIKEFKNLTGSSPGSFLKERESFVVNP